MKSLILTGFFISAFFYSHAQDSVRTAADEYIYVRVNRAGNPEKVTLDVDHNGRYEPVKDAQGNALVLPSTADAISYFDNQGWGLFLMKGQDALVANSVQYVFRKKSP